MKTLALLVLLGSVVPVIGFEGRLVDQDGAPVSGAEISVLGHPGVVRTDAAGRFDWSPEPALPFEIFIVLPNGTYLAPVFVDALPATGPLVITARSVLNEDVTVTSGAAPATDATPVSARTAIAREDLATRHPARLTDVIANIPGAGSVSDLHASVPSLRGLARGRTLLLIDGARVTTERRAGPSATFLDPFFLEGVEVARGPGSVGYGSDAFGGVIHARTRRVEPGSPTSVRLLGALGLGLPEATGGAEIVHGLDRGGLVLQARHRNFESYRSPDGEVFNSQASDSGFLGRFMHQLGDDALSVSWQSSFARDTGRPDDQGMDRVTSYPEEDSHRLTMSYDAAPRLGFTRIGFTGFWGQYQLVTDRHTRLSAPDSVLTSVADVRAKDFSFRGSGVRPVGPARWELGVDVNGRYGLHAVNELLTDDVRDFSEVAVDTARRIDTGIYTSTEILAGSRWSVGAGARFDDVTTSNEGGFFGDLSTRNQALSGYGSLKVELGRGLSLTGQLARGFRDPTLSDRYFRGISGRGIATGNPDLEPEQANQLDTALRYVRGGMRWAVYGYYYRFSDLIERYETRDELFFFRNRGEANLRGLEVEMQASFWKRYSIEASGQIARGNTSDDDAPVDDIPAGNVKLGLRRQLGDRSYAQVRLAWFAKDELPGPTEMRIPSYATFDVGAGIRLSPRFELRALVRNLFDQRYPVSPDARAVYAPGVNGVVTFVAEF